jgi:hypothetical protein
METIHITSQDEFRVAVLHQAAATPTIGGVLKPAKQGTVPRYVVVGWEYLRF